MDPVRRPQLMLPRNRGDLLNDIQEGRRVMATELVLAVLEDGTLALEQPRH